MYMCIARVRKVFVCSHVNWGFFVDVAQLVVVFMLVVAQVAQSSNPPRLVDFEEFSNPLLIRTPTCSGSKSTS